MKKPILLGFCLCCWLCSSLAQHPDKKRMNHDVFDIWKTIQRPMISNDGDWIVYNLNNEGRDPLLQLYHAPTKSNKSFPRGTGAQISEDSQWLVFQIKQPQDSLRAMRKRKVKKKALPKDSLGIYHLSTGQLQTIANVQSFQLPKKWSGWLAYHLAVTPPMPKDSTQKTTAKNPKEKKGKKANKKNGTPLVIHQLKDRQSYRFEFVKNYVHAEEGPRFAFSSTGKDSTWLAGVYVFDCQKAEYQAIFQHEGKYPQLNFDRQGQQCSFIADLDSTKAAIRPFELYYWQHRDQKARLVKRLAGTVKGEKYWVSQHLKPYFSENGQQLYFGTAPHPIVKDTTLLPEEVVQVEVWSYTDPQLHTQQKVLLEQEKKRYYLAVWHPKEDRLTLLGNQPERPRTVIGDEGNSSWVLAYNEQPYLQNISWDGFPIAKDASLIHIATGEQVEVAKGIRGNLRFSPQAKYLTWYSTPDTAWYAYSVEQKRQIQLTNNRTTAFYNERNDAPQFPSSYGFLGWTKGDKTILIYDRFDIWQIDPQAPQKAKRLTQGRENQLRYRYISLDPEERFIHPKAPLLLHTFDEQSKASGYAHLSLRSGEVRQLVKANFAFSQKPLKARDADRLIFTKQSFEQFPDLLYSNLTFENPQRISQANPQQLEYSWGNIELYHWTNLDGERMEGLLVKPENFDPNKKYPVIVNFYERSADRLHRHRAPYPHRSTINYTFYTNRGYVIFNPDVKYRVGYPGESAYNCVVSGVTALIGEGFVDEQNIGVQGHSWGGYQIAHLITKTNIFKCAESGAPVVNMFSAYGGIRWGSGLSRMFQYEHTQSRIGGTIWEYPIRYLENSPLFFIDKIQTPVLILHNDKDGAVPWYQGIEFFVALRRLGKPAWLLNYNKEPHWPLKRQNRLDFNKRMAQFFDHYLMGAPQPQWMQRGVPAIEKGIRQGFEAGE
ncbi:MAG: prolyl oligopeptidase family serine peptidase [Bacteroidota bacterium]